MNEHITERVIEDILVADKRVLSQTLGLDYSELEMLARQKMLKSGILDLLYIYRNELILIELKAVPFYKAVIEQINDYYDDLVRLQNDKKLISAPIHKYIIVTSANLTDREQCQSHQIKLITYEIKSILSAYYEHFKGISGFMNIQSGDFGVVRLGLLNNTLKLLGDGHSIEEIAKISERKTNTIRNRISVAAQLGLTAKLRSNHFLTELGEKFVESLSGVDDRLSDNQRELILSFIKDTPYYSSITYSIFSMVESVFILSKSKYPVPTDNLRDYFVKSVGKTSTWNALKAQNTATYIFSNYAIELGLLAKVDNEFFITPAGIQAVLLLQLNRSIKLIEQG